MVLKMEQFVVVKDFAAETLLGAEDVGVCCGDDRLCCRVASTAEDVSGGGKASTGGGVPAGR